MVFETGSGDFLLLWALDADVDVCRFSSVHARHCSFYGDILWTSGRIDVRWLRGDTVFRGLPRAVRIVKFRRVFVHECDILFEGEESFKAPFLDRGFQEMDAELILARSCGGPSFDGLQIPTAVKIPVVLNDDIYLHALWVSRRIGASECHFFAVTKFAGGDPLYLYGDESTADGSLSNILIHLRRAGDAELSHPAEECDIGGSRRDVLDRHRRAGTPGRLNDAASRDWSSRSCRLRIHPKHDEQQDQCSSCTREGVPGQPSEIDTMCITSRALHCPSIPNIMLSGWDITLR